VVGFQRDGEGLFAMVEVPRTDRESIQQAVRAGGGKLVGITHAGVLPEGEEDLKMWLEHFVPRLRAGDLPLIAPPVPEPSPNRFVIAGLVQAAAALAALFALGNANSRERRELEARNNEFATLTNESVALAKRAIELKTREAVLQKEWTQMENVSLRTRSVRTLLKALATHCPEDVVVRGLEADGPSAVIVTGLALEASAVDKLSMVLTKELNTFGWTAQTRSKTGKKSMANGGPWEFSVVLTHEESTRAQPGQLTQNQ
jgi:hypothetical protein